MWNEYNRLLRNLQPEEKGARRDNTTPFEVAKKYEKEFLDDLEKNIGLTLSGLPIMGLQSDAGAMALNCKADAIFIIQDSISGKALRDILNDCELNEIRVQMIPSVDDVLSGDLAFRLRDVNIDDLLRRDPVELDSNQINQMLKNPLDIFRLAIRRQTHQLVLTGIDLEPGVIGEGGIQQAERVREINFPLCQQLIAFTQPH